MDPATLSLMLTGLAGQFGMQQLGGQPGAVPQVTAQVPQNQAPGQQAAPSPFNQQRGQQMMSGLGPLASPIKSSAELDAIEDSVEAPKQQVTDSAETPSFGQKLGTAATSPEALSAMMQLAMMPQSRPAPSVAPMNTTSSFQGGAGMNPYQMLAQRRR